MIEKVVLTFWFKELIENPTKKINDLENTIGSFYKKPFLVSQMDTLINLNIPRIVTESNDTEKSLVTFNMTLCNSSLIIDNKSLDNDELMMLVNEQFQFIYTELKKLYDLDVIYCSTKFVYTEKLSKKEKIELYKDLNLEDNVEDFEIKKGFESNKEYYINRSDILSREIKVDLQLPKVQISPDDMHIRAMLVSTEESQLGDYIHTIEYEINDRLKYNLNKDYRVTSDDLRNLLFEFREIVKELKK